MIRGDVGQTNTNRRLDGTAEIPPCFVCETRHFRKLFTKKGRAFWRCLHCGLERQYPLPSPDELKQYYEDSYREGMYKEFTEASEMKRLTSERRLRRIMPYCNRGRWLDVGCSNGVFLAELKAKGIEGEGIDLSTAAVQQARKRGVAVYCCAIEEHHPPYEFDTVTAFDVLEHVLDPLQFLVSAKRLLKPTGTLALSVPNLQSLSCRVMRKHWYHYIPEEHFYYFRPATVQRLLERAGFNPLFCRATNKPVTYDYALVQFQEYNASIYRVLKVLSFAVPSKIRQLSFPVPVGEMLVIAQPADRLDPSGLPKESTHR